MSEAFTAPSPAPAASGALLPFDRSEARAVVERGIRRYIAERRAMVPDFVDRNFGIGGAFRLHRVAVGLDLVRAPINIAAGFATLVKNVGAIGCRVAGAHETAAALSARSLFLETAVAREVRWRAMTELLELPYADRDRRFERDALVEAILADGRLQAHFADLLTALGRRADDAAFRRQVSDALTEYTGSRAAAADLTSSLMAAGAGFVAYQKLTPGMASLSAAVATSLAHQAAVSSFTLGPWFGKLYYALFAAATPPVLYASVFAALMVPLAVLTAFAGVVADPLQRALGLHRRRLNRMIDALELNLLGADDARFKVSDHYVARVLDLFDWTVGLVRLARG